MSKVKLTTYVQTLHALTAGQDEASVRQNFAGFLQLLTRRHQLHLWPEILRLLEERLNAGQSALKATVYYQGQPPSPEILHTLQEFLQSHFAGQSIQFDLQAKDIGSGLIVDVAGERFDWSLQRQLQAFSRQLALG
ncbi:F0F1 ATP synthase subunit delta [bacterium]|nr:F0F1 ATP synthase subunit delta [bacterium]